MDFGEFELDGLIKGSKVTRLKCLFCRRWVRFDELKEQKEGELEDVPCPHCGETGEEFRKKQQEVLRAYENWKAGNES